MDIKKLFMRTIPLLMIFLVCVSTAVFAQQSAEQTPVAMVIRINGAMLYRTAAGADWQSAKPNQPLYNGNQVKTELGNRAIILYTGSGTRILVNENTELEISAESPGKAGTPERTKLIAGEVYSKIIPKKAAGYKYEVETPSSVASVRGTEFNSQFQNGEATYLSIQNVVEVMNQLGTVLLNQYQQTKVRQGQAPSDPSTLTKGQAQKQTSWTGKVEPIWKLNLVPEGGASQATGKPFMITVWAENKETSMIDVNASFKLSSFTASSAILEFSADNGKTWGGAPEITLSSGQAVLTARATAEGNVSLGAEAQDCEPAALSLTIAKPKAKKTLQLQFSNPDGTNVENLQIELEEK